MSTAACVAALAVAGAAALLLPAAPVRSAARSRVGVPLLALGVLGLVTTVAASPVTVAWAGIGLAVLAVGRRMLRARAADRDAWATAQRVAEACQGLAVELRAGVPPGRALDRVTRVWGPAEAVRVAHELGADVPQAWRALAARPGAEGLCRVAAAWQVSQHTGQGLARAIDRVADDLRRDRETQRLVRGELASARATARLVAVLPGFALLLGAGGGGDPLGFLLHTPAGLGCLAGGLALAALGLSWIERLARAVTDP